MTKEDSPEGTLFSRAYLRSPTAQRDSARFRTRLLTWFGQRFTDGGKERLLAAIRLELGAEIEVGDWGVSWHIYFRQGELRDVLDTLTLMHRLLVHYGTHDDLRTFVNGVFQDESLGYVMDSKGGVRFAVDAEYERNRFAVIDGMGGPRYGAVKHAVESAFKRLDGDPDTKAAVREMFEAAEILAKLMTGSNEDLDDRMVQRRLKPMAQKLYGDNPSAASFADQMLEGFAKWVNAGHRYRHGQRTEDPIAPPLDMAVAYLSAGASHIRFLLQIDQITMMLG